MRSFGIASVVFLSSASVVVACATTTTVTDDGDAGTSSSSSGGHKTTSSSSGTTSSSGSTSTSSGSTSSSSGTTSSSGSTTSSSGSTGTANKCTGAGTVNVAKTSTPADASGCPAAVDLGSADLDSDPGWKCTSATKGSCTAGDITTFENNLKDTNIKTYFDLGTGLSAACKTCVISKDTDTSWNLVVGSASDNGQSGFMNFGACFGFVEGANCGKASQYEQFCYNVACNDCATTQQAYDQCVQTAGTGGCKGFGDATATACPNIKTTATSCADPVTAVKTMCGQ